MLSINMRIFKSILLLSALFTGAFCMPPWKKDFADESSSSAPTTRAPGDFYDQRQNGTDNYRVNVDGLVFVIAPMESLVVSAGESNFSPPGQNEISKPHDKPKPEHDGMKPIPAPKSAQRSPLRLSQLLAPLLHRIRQD